MPDTHNGTGLEASVLTVTVNTALSKESQFLILVIPKSSRNRSHVDEANYLVKMISKSRTENGASLI